MAAASTSSVLLLASAGWAPPTAQAWRHRTSSAIKLPPRRGGVLHLVADFELPWRPGFSSLDLGRKW